MSASINMNSIFDRFVPILAEQLDLDIKTVQAGWANAWTQLLKVDFSVKAVNNKADKPKTKRAKSAYNLFCEAERVRIAEENADNKPSAKEILVMINKTWKELSDEDKKPYAERAEELKANNSDDEAEPGVKPVKQGKAPKKAKAAVAKKPKNAYQLFCDDSRARIAEECAAEGKDKPAPKEMLTMINSNWNELSEDEKKPYAERAAELKANFQVQPQDDEVKEEAKPKKAKADAKPKKADAEVKPKKAKADAKKEEAKPKKVVAKKDFDFSEEAAVPFTDNKWWKTVTLELEDDEYKYHKLTNLVFKLEGDSLTLQGRLCNGELVLADDLSEEITEWCKACGIGEEQAEEEVMDEEDVDALFDDEE
jgi:hypothetical protein